MSAVKRQMDAEYAYDSNAFEILRAAGWVQPCFLCGKLREQGPKGQDLADLAESNAAELALAHLGREGRIAAWERIVLLFLGCDCYH